LQLYPLQYSGTSCTQTSSHELLQQNESDAQTALTQLGSIGGLSQPAVKAAPVERKGWAQEKVSHFSELQTVRTSVTQIESHAVWQQNGSAVQMSFTQASPLQLLSGSPVVHLSCAGGVTA